MKATSARCVFVCLLGLGGLSAADNSELAARAGHPTVPFARSGEARPHSWIVDDAGGGKPAVTPAKPYGFSPSQMLTAYGIDVTNGGIGQTVAIVDAYDSPNVLADLNTFSQVFSLPAFNSSNPNACSPTFMKLNENGARSPVPQRNSGWEVEINLDTQWVHAMAPCANIVLVEANSGSLYDLLTAVLYARSVASVVSMSWGGSEFNGETSYDFVFNKLGVTFLASSGDSGGIVAWPAASQYVVGVGGTQLTLNPNGGYGSETAWSGSGGGCSLLEPAVLFQHGVIPSSCTHRGVPDVAIAGGNQSAVAVYVSDQGGWYEVYGTSLSVQMWAGIIAVVNGMRSNSLQTALADLYSDSRQAPAPFQDIVTGSAGRFLAGPGWDFITGLGTPHGNPLISPDLVNALE